MSAGEFDGLVAVVTGGASGIGLATAETLAGSRRDGRRARPQHRRPARRAHRLRRRRLRPRLGRRGRRGDRRPVRRHRHRREQRRHQRGRHGRGERRRRMGARARHQRRRHGAGHCGGAAVAASIGCRGRRQPLLDRRAQRAAAARAVLGVEGRGARVDVRDGDRPRRRGHPRELREPGDGARRRSSSGCCRASPIPWPNAPRSTPGRRPAAWSTPAEVAAAIAYLASPLSGSTTGTALDVDGGMTHLRVRPAAARA